MFIWFAFSGCDSQPSTHVKPAQMHTTVGYTVSISSSASAGFIAAAAMSKGTIPSIGVFEYVPTQFCGPNASRSAPPTCPDAPITRTRPRGARPVRWGRRTASGGAAVSFADISGATPSGTGHATPKSGSCGWVSASFEGSKHPSCR